MHTDTLSASLFEKEIERDSHTHTPLAARCLLVPLPPLLLFAPVIRIMSQIFRLKRMIARCAQGRCNEKKTRKVSSIAKNICHRWVSCFSLALFEVNDTRAHVYGAHIDSTKGKIKRKEIFCRCPRPETFPSRRPTHQTQCATHQACAAPALPCFSGKLPVNSATLALILATRLSIAKRRRMGKHPPTSAHQLSRQTKNQMI